MTIKHFCRNLINLIQDEDCGQRIVDILKNRYFCCIIKHSLYKLPCKSDYVLEGFVAKVETSKLDNKIAKELYQMYTLHYFDLLGSGWVQVGYKNNAMGIEGYKYDALVLDTDTEGKFLKELIPLRQLRKSKQIWKMVDEGYKGIDWQKDFKSGWRWNTKMFYQPRKWPELGGDIKVPWELARLQHLPRLAILAKILPNKQQQLFREFRNQSLDFISLNPMGWGVNYMCAMDVAIRTANMVLAWNLWASIEAIQMDEDFLNVYFEFIYEQCYFIYHNLEWRAGQKGNAGNHYMADIVGLIWGTSVLRLKGNVRKWYEFAVGEFFDEIGKQYYVEGTNKEASAGYHRLTTEMVAYTVALLDYRGVEIPKDVYSILAGAAYFMATITRPDGMFTQIGDNDSGRFFRLSFYGEVDEVSYIRKKYKTLENYSLDKTRFYFDEDMNRTSELLMIVSMMVNNAELSRELDSLCLNSELEGSLIQDLIIAKRNAAILHHTFEKYKIPSNLTYEHKEKYFWSEKIDLKKLRLYEFPDIGILIIKSPEIYLVLNLSEIPLDERIGHTHNDKLSIELFERGACQIEDGGTYLYTAIPEEQLRDKSVRNHLNIIIDGMEQDRMDKQGRWYVKRNEIKCYLVEASCENVIAYVRYRDIVHLREIRIRNESIEIIDKANKVITCVKEKRRITSGYGKWLNEEWVRNKWKRQKQ